MFSGGIISDADGWLMTALSLMEASMVLAGHSRGEQSWSGLDALISRAQVVPQENAQAAIARDAFLRFDKGRHPAGFNISECASYALAKSRSLPLLFNGNDFGLTDLTAAG